MTKSICPMQVDQMPPNVLEIKIEHNALLEEFYVSVATRKHGLVSSYFSALDPEGLSNHLLSTVRDIVHGPRTPKFAVGDFVTFYEDIVRIDKVDTVFNNYSVVSMLMHRTADAQANHLVEFSQEPSMELIAEEHLQGHLEKINARLKMCDMQVGFIEAIRKAATKNGEKSSSPQS